MPVTFEPMDLERDGDLLIRYANDLFTSSFDSSKFCDRFGEDGYAYLSWIAEKQALGRENGAIALLDEKPVGMLLVGRWAEDPEIGYVYHY
jgi:hypothetical protein